MSRQSSREPVLMGRIQTRALERRRHRLAGRCVPDRPVLSVLAVTTRVPSGLKAAFTTSA